MDAIQEFIDAKDYYSAQQKARTTVSRLLGVKGAAATKGNQVAVLPMDDKARRAVPILFDTALRLLQAQQIGSGVDLALFLIDIYRSRGVSCEAPERAQFTQLIALVGSTGSWRKTLSDAVFSWTAATGSGPAGDPLTHRFLGETLYKEGNLPDATYHLLCCPTSDAAATLADVQYAWSKVDSEGATGAGRYPAKCVLTYLESEALLAAKTFLTRFISLYLTDNPAAKVVHFPYPSPGSALAQSKPDIEALGAGDEIVVTRLASLNFLQLAIRTCQAGEGTYIDIGTVPYPGRNAWTSLLKYYQTQVKWFALPVFKESIEHIGTIYFDIQPPRPASNPMMDMLGSLFSGGGGGAPAIGSK